MLPWAQTDGGDLKMSQLELVSFSNLSLQLRRLGFSAIEGLLNDLVQKMISEDFHDRSVHRRFWQREHLLETIIRQPDPQVAVRDQNAFDETGQNRTKAKVLVGNLLSDLPLPLCHLLQVLMDLPEDPRAGYFIGKNTVGNQVADLAPQEK